MTHNDYFRPGKNAKIDRIVEGLKEVYDPEIPTNIYDLGLIYNIKLMGQNACHITMTLTSAFCPVADELVEDVRRAAGRVCGDKVDVELVFEPPWSVDSIPEHIRLEMGIL